MEPPQRKVNYVRRSRAEILKHLEAFKTSGLTQQAFCRKHGLSAATFSKWRHKAKASGSESALRPVQLSSAVSANAGTSVRFPDGLEVAFPSDIQMSQVAELIIALKSSGIC